MPDPSLSDRVTVASVTTASEDERRWPRRSGRERPDEFNSTWTEIGFLLSIAISQLLDEYLASGFVSLVPRLVLELNLSRSFTTWAVSVVPLIVSSFLLPFGRLVDLYGPFKMYFAGLIWVLAWSLVAAVANHRVLLVSCRAMQGLGSAAHLSAGLAMFGTLYRPGARKNLVFSLYGAMAPLGSFLGIATGGLVLEYARWSWYFWIGALLAICPLVGIWVTAPSLCHKGKDTSLKMDWLGSLTISTGVLMLVFTATELAHAPQGWKTPYILATGSLSLVSLGSAVYVEGWVAQHPLLPFSVLKISGVRPVLIGLLLNYGTIGIFMLYATLYIRNVIGAGSLQLVAWFSPMAFGGCSLAIFGGFLLHLIPGNMIFVISGVSSIAASLMFALAPPKAGFWDCVFPAMVFATVSIDLVFNRANVFLSTAMPSHKQGLAASLSNVLVHLSVAIILGLGEVVAAKTSGQGEARSYKNVFCFAAACGAAALIVFTLFVRVGKAASEPVVEDEEEGEEMNVNLPAPREKSGTSPCSHDALRGVRSIDIADYKLPL